MIVPLGLTAAASATDAAIHNKIFGFSCCSLDLAARLSDLASCTTILIITNKEMNDIMKIVKSVEESRLLIKGVSETVKNEAK